MRDHHAGEKRPSGGLVLEPAQQPVDQSRDIGKEQHALLTARRTQIEVFAGKGQEVVASALTVGTADPSDSLEIVTALCKSLADLLDALESVHPVGGGVLLVVSVAKVGKVVSENRV